MVDVIQEEASSAELPDGWEAHVSTSRRPGRTYYKNAATGEQSWNHPVQRTSPYLATVAHAETYFAAVAEAEARAPAAGVFRGGLKIK